LPDIVAKGKAVAAKKAEKAGADEIEPGTGESEGDALGSPPPRRQNTRPKPKPRSLPSRRSARGRGGENESSGDDGVAGVADDAPDVDILGGNEGQGDDEDDVFRADSSKKALTTDRPRPRPQPRPKAATPPMHDDDDDEVPVRAARSQPSSSPALTSKPPSPPEASPKKHARPVDSDEEVDGSSPDPAPFWPLKSEQTYVKPMSQTSQMSMGYYQSKRKRIRR
jgi:hypothetical protein